MEDRFVLSQDAAITTVRWWGLYNNLSLDPAVLSPMAFRVAFFNDDSGTLGTEIRSETVAAGVVDSGVDQSAWGYPAGLNIYLYEADLAAAFLASAGQPKWVLVSEDDLRTVRIGSTQWLWSRSVLATDQAFALLGNPTPIPAPGALLLGAIGVSCLGWLRRRRAR